MTPPATRNCPLPLPLSHVALGLRLTLSTAFGLRLPLFTRLVAAATYLRRRLRYQLVAAATYLPKPRFSSQRPSAGSTDRYGMPVDIPSKVIKTDILGRQKVYRTDRYGMPIGDPIEERIIE